MLGECPSCSFVTGGSFLQLPSNVSRAMDTTFVQAILDCLVPILRQGFASWQAELHVYHRLSGRILWD